MRNDQKKLKEVKEEVKKGNWVKENKQAFQDYQQHLELNSKALRTQMLYADNVKSLGDFRPNKGFNKLTEKDTKDYKIHLSEKYGEYNIHNKMLDIITFLKWLLKIKEKPDCMEWYQTNDIRKKVMKKLNPEQILNRDDIKKMIAAVNSNRNKAIIHTLFESGNRRQEHQSINVEDVSFDDKVVSLWVSNSKTERRQVFLIESAPVFLSWWREHEFKDNPKAPLFYAVSTKAKGNRLQGNYIHCLTTRAGKDAKINKPCNPHALRKARATDIAKKRHSGQIMKAMFGWSKNSNMPDYYAQISGEDVKTALKEDAGLTNKKIEVNVLEPKPCPFCQYSNEPEAQICGNLSCMRPITVEGVSLEKKKKEELILEVMQNKFDTFEEKVLTSINKQSG